MPIVYVRLDVAIHGLELESDAEMEALRQRVKQLVEEYHPSGYSNIMDSDVEVEIAEHAGAPNASCTPDDA